MSLLTVFPVLVTFLLLLGWSHENALTSAEYVEIESSRLVYWVGGDKTIVAQIYLPWCKVCERFHGEWDAFAKDYPSTGPIVIAKIDAEEFRAKERLGVSAVPAFWIFHKGPWGDESGPYPGNDLNITNIKKWMNEEIAKNAIMQEERERKWEEEELAEQAEAAQHTEL